MQADKAYVDAACAENAAFIERLKPNVKTRADLPADSKEGDIRCVEDEIRMYTFHAGAWHRAVYRSDMKEPR